MRTCNKCGETKPLDKFRKGRSQCKLCYSERRKQHHENNKERENERSRQFYNTVEGRALALLQSAKARATKRGEFFSVTLDHIEFLLRLGYCPVAGIAFRLSSEDHKFKHQHPFSPSLDRIDSNKPYTNDNTRLVILQYNLMKGGLTDDQIYKICKKIVEKRRTDEPRSL